MEEKEKRGAAREKGGALRDEADGLSPVYRFVSRERRGVLSLGKGFWRPICRSAGLALCSLLSRVSVPVASSPTASSAFFGASDRMRRQYRDEGYNPHSEVRRTLGWGRGGRGDDGGNIASWSAAPLLRNQTLRLLFSHVSKNAFTLKQFVLLYSARGAFITFFCFCKCKLPFFTPPFTALTSLASLRLCPIHSFFW